MISDQDAEKAVEYLRDSAETAAQARAERIYLEQWLKTVKAQCQAEKTGSVAATEIQALTDDRYLQALQAVRESVAADEKARFMREAAAAKLEAWRTLSATRRAEGKAYGQ